MDNKELLYKAGKMADLALSLVGGMGLYGQIRPADPDQFSEVARNLRAAVEDYNEAIMSYTRSSQIEFEPVGARTIQPSYLEGQRSREEVVAAISALNMLK